MKTIDVNLTNNAHTIYLGKDISSDLSSVFSTNHYDIIFIL